MKNFAMKSKFYLFHKNVSIGLLDMPIIWLTFSELRCMIIGIEETLGFLAKIGFFYNKGNAMEELFVYALLYVIGYDKTDEYHNTLDRLFLDEPTNEELLDLEGMKWKDAMLHLLHLMKSKPINNNKFGAFLMRSLKPIYLESDIFDFGGKMYKLWNLLPSHMDEEEPFFTFCYADDCLSYGNEKQCRILYEEALNYYEKK